MLVDAFWRVSGFVWTTRYWCFFVAVSHLVQDSWGLGVVPQDMVAVVTSMPGIQTLTAHDRNEIGFEIPRAADTVQEVVHWWRFVVVAGNLEDTLKNMAVLAYFG